MTFTVTTVNVNGIRAAVRERSEENRGFLPWLENSPADVVCLQEVRASDAQMRKAIAPALDAGWRVVASESSAKGRAGVAILSRADATAVRIGHGDDEFADSGRYIQADFVDALEGETVTVGSLYLPSGEAETERQAEKERFLVTFAEFLGEQAARGGHAIVAGDWNIAHREADLKNHKANHKTSGFLPNERAWLDGVFGEESPWVDVVRSLHPGVAGPYSWWSYRGKAFDNDAGWRIDYQVATRDLASRARDAYVERADAYALRWSDHAPVTVRYA